MRLDFDEAIKAMDKGETVQMRVNPKNYFRLASDGVSFVQRPIDEMEFDEQGREWYSACFNTVHIRGEWIIVNQAVS